MAPHDYKVSFCITCKGRLDHLKETLPQNLKNNADYPNTEFVILNYDSPDGLEEWLQENYKAEIESGKIRYAKYAPAPHFKFAHAKNMAHRVATGDILCNLDADNTTGPGFAKWLNQEFSKDKNICVRPGVCTLAKQHILHGDKRWETCGRIALHRDNFLQLHGYDERISYWGGDDIDLYRRAQLAGLRTTEIPVDMLGHGIVHADERSSQYMAAEDQHISRQRKAAVKNPIGSLNQLRKTSRAKEIVPAENQNGQFGCGTVRINFGDEITLEPAPSLATARRTAVNTQNLGLGYNR